MRNSSKSVRTDGDHLIDYAISEDIAIFYGRLPVCESMSLCYGDKYYIAVDPFAIRSMADGRVKMAHEIGHCETGSFYNRYSSCDVRGKHEYRADKWAVHQLMPREAIARAVEEGCTEVWQLAERFDVTEEFVRRAQYVYRCEE